VTQSEPPRSQTPIGGSSDDDDSDSSEYIWSQSRKYFRKNKNWRAPQSLPPVLALPAPDSQKALPAPDAQLALSAPEGQKVLPAPEPQKALPAPSTGRNIAQEKAVPPPQPVSAPKPKGTAQGTSRKKPTEEARASKPMETRRQAASRAGGLRSGGGLGQPETRVVPSNPSKT
jgi:hypothetical protein